MSHVDEAQITAYLDQDEEYADPEKRRELGRHIADCLSCMRLLKDVRTNRDGAQDLLDLSRPPTPRMPSFSEIEERARSLPVRGGAPEPSAAGEASAAPPPAWATSGPAPTAKPSDTDDGVVFINPAPPERDDFVIDVGVTDELASGPPAGSAPDPFDIDLPDVDDAESGVTPARGLETGFPGLGGAGIDVAPGPAAEADDFDIDLPPLEPSASSRPEAPRAPEDASDAGFTIDLPVLDEPVPSRAHDDDADLLLDLPVPARPPAAPETASDPFMEPDSEEAGTGARSTYTELPMINPDATGSMLAAIDAAEGADVPPASFDEPAAEAEPEPRPAAERDEADDAGWLVSPEELSEPDASLEVPSLDGLDTPELASEETPALTGPSSDLIRPIGDPDTETGVGFQPVREPEDTAPEDEAPTDSGFQLESVTDWDSGAEADESSALPPLELESASLDNDAAPPSTLPLLGLETTSLAEASASSSSDAPTPAAGMDDFEADDGFLDEPEPEAPAYAEPDHDDGVAAVSTPLADEPPPWKRDSDWDVPQPPAEDDLAVRRARATAEESDRPRRPWDPPEDEAPFEPSAGSTPAAPSRPTIGTFEAALGSGSRQRRRSSSSRRWMPIAAGVVVAVGGAAGAYSLGWFGMSDSPPAQIAGRGRESEPAQLASTAGTPAEPAASPVDSMARPEPETRDAPVPAQGLAAAADEPVTLGLTEAADQAPAAGARTDTAPSAAQRMLAQVTDSAARVAEDLDAAAIRSQVLPDTAAQAAEVTAARAPLAPVPAAPPVEESLNRSGMSMDEARALLRGPVIIVDGLPVESITRIGTTDGVRVVQTDPAGRSITLDVAPSGGVGDAAGLNSVSVFADAGGTSSTGNARFGPYRISARAGVPASVLQGYLQRLIEAPGTD